MISQARSYSAHLRAQADLLDAASDADFQIDVIRGSHVQHHVREVQKATSMTLPGTGGGKAQPPKSIKLIMGKDGPRIWWWGREPASLPEGEIIEYVPVYQPTWENPDGPQAA
ncbi:hypothetical protein BSL82_15830 [Tardibacter chloracetimidivorans]|uniref:Uncharacterized protein n=2 Tax=Tardibacter chloracetimidivorans TaxID=1921510 RepID=A0A1L3ZY81_9SPHN|nr:hypothetical protein BSL82_15830 [Tardibacter chloracetimidivorans]